MVKYQKLRRNQLSSLKWLRAQITDIINSKLLLGMQGNEEEEVYDVRVLAKRRYETYMQ